MMQVRTGLGIDSHRFVDGATVRPLILGGLTFDDAPPLAGNSDADVLLHALTDAISGITGKTVIGKVADALCQQGIRDSKIYLEEARKDLDGWSISHVSMVIEGKRPKLDPKVPALRASVADLLGLKIESVCLTATTGEALSDIGRGLGLQATVIVTAVKN